MGYSVEYKEELKEFILQTLDEASKDFISTISDDEAEEIEDLYRDSLNKPRNEEDYELL